MANAEDAASIIDELYAGVLDRARLSSAIGDIVRMAGADGGYIYAQHRGEDYMRFAVFSNIDFEILHKIDPGTARTVGEMARRLPLGQVRSVASTWPLEEMKRTAFYREVLASLDLMHGAGGLTVRNSEYYGIVVLTRSERAGPFSEDQSHALQVFIPHLRNVLQISNAMGALSSERAAFATALDGLPDGVVLTDAKGKVVYLNRAAEQMIARNDGLAIKAGFLAASLSDEERALHRLIGQAAANRGADSFERGGSCAISRPSGAPAWLAMVTPCGDMQAAATVPSFAACAVLIRDRSRQSQDGLAELRQAYGLTFQESKVALAVAEGRGLAEAAQSLGLSALTVRNHLQRVFDKTGASRQAALVRLVATLSA